VREGGIEKKHGIGRETKRKRDTHKYRKSLKRGRI
jgi:hypothetical protein